MLHKPERLSRVILQSHLIRLQPSICFVDTTMARTSWHKRLVPPDAYAVLCCTSQADATFSIRFAEYSCPYFMFATGDLVKWLIASKEAVIGEYYYNSPRSILRCDTTYI